MGEYQEGVYSGKGVYIWGKDGKRYEGMFKKGLKNGRGTLMDSAGEVIIDGMWENGKFVSEM